MILVTSCSHLDKCLSLAYIIRRKENFMFLKAILRRPGKSMVHGITTANLGKPDYERALEQHDRYRKALEDCGLTVTVMEADEAYPDSVFIEDTAVVKPEFAVITNPGHLNRRGEEKPVAEELEKIYQDREYIRSPGTLDGGDVMECHGHFYVGISDRTNWEGAEQFGIIVSKYGYGTSTIQVDSMLHLKSGVSFLGGDQVLISENLAEKQAFSGFDHLILPEEEVYAANSLWVNGNILMPEGFPEARRMVEREGYRIITVDVSEFRKLDGGLSCLSLRI